MLCFAPVTNNTSLNALFCVQWSATKTSLSFLLTLLLFSRARARLPAAGDNVARSFEMPPCTSAGKTSTLLRFSYLSCHRSAVRLKTVINSNIQVIACCYLEHSSSTRYYYIINSRVTNSTTGGRSNSHQTELWMNRQNSNVDIDPYKKPRKAPQLHHHSLFASSSSFR